jgi:ferredoxin
MLSSSPVLRHFLQNSYNEISLRTGFSFGDKHIPFRGVRITEECIACGECQEGCSFKAIYQQDEKYIIGHTKCDVCGDCYTICPTSAVEIVIEDPKIRPYS